MTPEQLALQQANDLLRLMHRFCASGERGVLSNHVCVGGFVYCSDGHVAVRAPSTLWSAMTEDTFDAPNFERVWRGEDVVDRWCRADLSLVEIPPVPPCSFCGGAGAIECPTCSHEADCEDCGGTGSGGINRHKIPVMLGANTTCARRLKMILDAFPDAVFSATHSAGFGIPWKAAQVTGVVMPVKVEEDWTGDTVNVGVES